MTPAELNEKVARKLGWVNKRMIEDKPQTLGWIREGYYQPMPTAYSTSIEAAWEIVEHLRKTHQIMVDVAFNKFQVTICNEPPNEINFTFEADTAPLAIVLCFLKLP
jgi:hypothetical protein